MDFLKTLLAYVALTVAFSVQEGATAAGCPDPDAPAAERDGIPDS